MSPVIPPTESRCEARWLRHRRATGRRLPVAAALLVSGVLALLGSIPASAYWQSVGSGVGMVGTGTLAAPTNVTASASGTTVTVRWTASTGSVAATGYLLTRTSGGAAVPVCGTSTGTLVTDTSCTDTAVPVGTYTYTVTAVYRSWTAVSAASGSVTVEAASKLAFTATPTTTAAGAAFSVAVAVQSPSGAPVQTAYVPITLTLGANPAGGTLSGTTSATTDDTGVARFTGLSLGKTGGGYTLVATSAGLASATSPAFVITAGAAATFAFTTAAVSGSASDAANLGPVTVQLRDAFGNVAIAPAGGVPLVLASTSTGAAVFSPTSQGAAGAVGITAGTSSATFYYGDTRAGSAQISVSSAAVPAITQTATITAAAPAKLVFGQQPGDTVQGAVIAPAVTARIVDQFGNQTTSTATVSIAIVKGSSNRGELSGSTSRAAVNGVVSFGDLKVNANGNQAVGTGYTLQVTSPGLVDAISVAFDILKP
jgi:hypothetical protein